VVPSALYDVFSMGEKDRTTMSEHMETCPYMVDAWDIAIADDPACIGCLGRSKRLRTRIWSLATTLDRVGTLR
jgi:hypothetical protein